MPALATAPTSSPPVRLTLSEWQQDVYRSPARFRVVVTGRRGGKTHLARVELIARALRQPGRYWYIAPTLKDAKDIFWADLKAAIDPSWLAMPPHETELKVILRGGGEIRLYGADEPAHLRGRGLKFVVLDEYADMKPAVWEEVIRPALSDYRAPALFIGTPKSFNHFYTLYERGQDPERPGWASWQFTSLHNPFLDPDEIESARHDMGEREFRQEYEASFEALAGRAYYAFSREHNIAPVTLELGDPACLFFDFNIEPATGGIAQRQGDRAMVWRTVQLTHRGGEATKACAQAVQDLLVQAGHVGPLRIYGDATGRAAKTTGPADHAVLRQMFPGAVWCIPGHNPHEKDRVASVNAVCASADGTHRLVVDPQNTALIADLEQVIYADNGELDKKSNPRLTHLSDGLGYWVVRDFPMVVQSRAGMARIERLL